MSAKLNVLQLRIAELVAQHNSYRGAAKAVGVSAPYLQRLFSGAKTDPSDAALVKLGLRRTVTYTRVTPSKADDNGGSLAMIDLMTCGI